MHFFVCEVFAGKNINHGVDGVECVFAVLTVVVIIVFLIGDSGVRTPAPAGVALAVSGSLIGLDIPGFLQVLVDFGKVCDAVLVPFVEVCRNILTFVDGDDLGGFCSALDIGVHVIEVVEVEFFQFFADLFCLCSADIDETVVFSIFVDVALGVAQDDGDFFVRTGAAENVVKGIEYVCRCAESFALFTELFDAGAGRGFATRGNFTAARNGFAAGGCNATARRCCAARGNLAAARRRCAA